MWTAAMFDLATADLEIPLLQWRCGVELSIDNRKIQAVRQNSRVECLKCRFNLLLQVRRSDQYQRTLPPADILGFQQQKGNTAKMITVQMAYHHGVDPGRVNTAAPKSDQTGTAAIEQQLLSGNGKIKTAVQSATTAKGIPATDTLQPDGSVHWATLPLVAETFCRANSA